MVRFILQKRWVRLTTAMVSVVIALALPIAVGLAEQQ